MDHLSSYSTDFACRR